MKKFQKLLVAASMMLLMLPAGGAEAFQGSKIITLGSLPQSAAEVGPKDNPYEVAAETVAAFIRYTEDKNEGEAMLNKLKGPEPLNPYGKQFLRDRLVGKEYVARSYIMGTSPQNKYTMEPPYKVEVIAGPYSFNEANYAKLFLKSSGADSMRPITLRKKPSTGEWFLWTYEGVLADIRQPVGTSGWD